MNRPTEWLFVLLDGLEEPDLMPLAVITFEGLFTSTGAVQLGHEMLDVTKGDVSRLAVHIWASLGDREFPPGELRERVGHLISAISARLPAEDERRALEHADWLLGRAESERPQPARRVVLADEADPFAGTDAAHVPGLEELAYTDGYMEGVMKGLELEDNDDDEPGFV
jgi:hypothetical protein